ncbi:hypothetical protein [Planctomicrobium sp. SH527]|uniref:hypothetical protein n=1 Tax=Planctomicrobium sp. SH527 TaxID=3448123 RepID=UPI003F5BD352
MKLFLTACAVAVITMAGMTNVSEAQSANSYNRGFRAGVRSAARGNPAPAIRRGVYNVPPRAYYGRPYAPRGVYGAPVRGGYYGGGTGIYLRF